MGDELVLVCEEDIKKCEELILEGTKKGITSEELDAILTYASALITLKADIKHVTNVITTRMSNIEALYNKYVTRK